MKQTGIQRLIDHAPVGIFYTDAAGDCSYVNGQWCQLTGLSSAQANNSAWQQALHPEDRARCQRAWQKAVETQTPYQTEHRYVHPNGKTMWILAQAFPEKGEGGELRGFIGTLIDITNRRARESVLTESYQQLEQQVSENAVALEQTNEELKKHQRELARYARLNSMAELASSLAHELSQPLGAINNYATGCLRRIQHGALEQEELLKIQERIAAQAQRAGDIMLRMRNLIHTGELNKVSAQINTIILDAIGYMDPGTLDPSLTINLQLDDELPEICVDKLQIEQVIINLLQNGIEAMKGCSSRDGALTVSTQAIGDKSIQVSVIDRGCGIPPESIDKLFDPFFTTKSDGAGLGLSICRSIIEAHDGRITISNHTEGGAMFTVDLPTCEH